MRAGRVVAHAKLRLAHFVRSAALGEDIELLSERDKLTFAADAFAVDNIELGGLEGCRDLILPHLHSRATAHNLLALLDGGNATDVEPYARVELERFTARGGLGVAEQDAYLHAYLIDEDDDGLRARNNCRELPGRLAHEPCLLAYVLLAHLALYLVFRRERSDRVDDNNVDIAAPDERLDDIERLFAIVRLADKELGELDPDAPSILGVKRVFGVDEGGDTTCLLRLCDDMEGQRGLTARLRAEYLDNASAR